MASTTPNATLVSSTVCVFLNKNLHYNSMFWKENPLNHIFPVLMLQVILSVLVFRVIHVILRPLKQPKLVCHLLAGVILGPSVLGRNKAYMESMFPAKEEVVIATLSQVASNLYTFIVCIKMDTIMLTKAAKHTWKLGVCCLAFPIVLIVSVDMAKQRFFPGLNPGNPFPVQFSVVSSLSYFIVVTRALDELNLLSSELGRISSSITMLNEVVSAAFVIIGIATVQKEAKSAFLAILSLCSFIVFALFVARPMLYWVIKQTPKGKPVKESYVVTILLSTFVMGVTTDAIGASFGGAFMVMGFITPDGPPLGTTIIRKSELILHEFFLPLFFVQIGYFTDLSAIKNWGECATFATIVIVGYIGRLIACLVFASSMSMRKSTAVLLSLVLSLQGLVELIQSIQWRHLQLIDDQTYATSVVSIIVVNAIITPIIEILYKPAVENFDVLRLGTRSLGTTSNVGELRIITCIQDEDNVPSIISLLEALNPQEISPLYAYVIHLVAVASQSVPTLAPYKNHLRKFVRPSVSDNIIRAFLNYSEHSKGPVQIQPFQMISPYKYMHQPISRLSDRIHAPLIIVPFFKSGEAHNIDGTLRIFNTNIQATAKCTVGLLVDRGLRSSILTTFSYNMAVIFISGSDDREALALASRASCQPNVSITVFRINLGGTYTLEDQIEKEADNALFRDFEAMNINNGRVECVEWMADDIEEVMKALRSLKSEYDLVVVGKHHANPELQALESWVQYSELGVIGDAIATLDFSGGKMSVLVLEHHHRHDDNQRKFDNCSYFSFT
ncbi:hypothetical protein Golax_022395 [Gossypium laxum]|uniref:Cation/H+ exchanger domain-containing protein n=1 Tax=Gossypium laxum TaxID=34288 RepID=A0A7J9AP17_9ROSI|nr:hypothetical protein [Gossypium laxum]